MGPVSSSRTVKYWVDALEPSLGLIRVTLKACGRNTRKYMELFNEINLIIPIDHLVYNANFAGLFTVQKCQNR